MSADTGSITISIDGERREVNVGAAAVRSNYTNTRKVERISRHAVGMYETNGTINQRSANLLVDT